MTKVFVQPDCGNSPKKILLRDFRIAFTNKNAEFILDTLDEDIQWTIVGDKKVKGKLKAEKLLYEMLESSIEELVIEHIITHGDTGSVNGTLRFANGKVFGFCDVYNFSSHTKYAKISQITSYVVAIHQT